MKRYLLILFWILSILPSLRATTYNVDAGTSMNIYCDRKAPEGNITHVFFEFYDSEDESYLGLSYSSSDCFATVYGLDAKSNIKLKVTYSYSYPVDYFGRIQYQVGHASYDIYVNVIGHTMPTQIKLTPEKSSPKVGETFRIKTNLTPSSTNCSLSWGVALGMPHRVEFLDWDNHDAIVRITRSGQYTIVATAPNDVFGACYIEVGDNTPTSINLPEAMTIYVGDPVEMNASFFPKNTFASLTWSCESNSVAIMSGSTICGLKEGTALVSCKTENGLVSNYCTVTVKHLKPTEISLLENSIYLPIGENKSLYYDLVPTNSLTSVTWKSSNSSIAKVSDQGVITGIKEGQANISITTDNGCTSMCKVIVPPNPQSIKLDKDYISILEGEIDRLTATVYPSDANSILTWNTTNEKVATVDERGNIFGRGQGECQIKVVSSNGIEAVCRVIVPKIDTYLVVWHKNGEKATFHFDTTPLIKYDNEKLLVTSNNTTVSYIEGDIQKITVENEIDDNNSDVKDVINDYYISPFSLTNAQPGSIVCIYDINGLLLDSYTIDHDGSIYHSLDKYTSGTYIIKLGSATIKIYKE